MKLISDKYRALNAELHNRNKKYGGKGHDWLDRVLGYIGDANSYLDYGCGKGTLADAVEEFMRKNNVGVSVTRYDPVTAPAMPGTVDFLTCCDVLEHIEPELLDNVLAHIASRINVGGRGLLVISQRLANKKLADGRNAHLIVEKTDWWVSRLRKHFWQIIEVDPIKPTRVGVELAVIVRPRSENNVPDGCDIRLRP